MTITNANANAQIIIANATAEAMSINATLAAQADAYAGLSSSLGLTGQALINYIAIQAISNANSVTIATNAPAQFSFPSNVTIG